MKAYLQSLYDSVLHQTEKVENYTAWFEIAEKRQ